MTINGKTPEENLLSALFDEEEDNEMDTKATECAECPDEECLSDGPHLVIEETGMLECSTCHCEFPNPFAGEAQRLSEGH